MIRLEVMRQSGYLRGFAGWMPVDGGGGGSGHLGTRWLLMRRRRGAGQLSWRRRETEWVERVAGRARAAV
jgi:hypothetical protein